MRSTGHTVMVRRPDHAEEGGMSLRTAGAHRPVRRPTAAQRFAQAECTGAQCYDTRRSARYVDLVATLAQDPTASLPEACRDAAHVRAASRFFRSAAVTP